MVVLPAGEGGAMLSFCLIAVRTGAWLRLATAGHRDPLVGRPAGELVGVVRARRVAGRAARDDEARRTGLAEVNHLAVHRQRGHGERAALAPAVGGGLDGVRIAAPP